MLNLPEVNECSLEECYYNQKMVCHAPPITVGSPCPRCDTFINSPQNGSPAEKGSVGACHEEECRFNNEMTCHAEAIAVGRHQGHADCLTYSPEE